MRLVLSFAAILLVTTTLFAQNTLEIDRAATAMAGQEASFTHTFTPKGFKTSQVERGTVLFGKLPSMRWSYSSPEEKLFIFDGSQSWFYVPGDKQVTVTRVSETMRRELPFLLLGDPSARGRVFTVSEKKSGNAIVTTLKPRAASALVKTVTVTIAPSTHLIQSIDYTDREGNRTSFRFSGYHPRPAAAASFRFEPPAGVQVVQQ